MPPVLLGEGLVDFAQRELARSGGGYSLNLERLAKDREGPPLGLNDAMQRQPDVDQFAGEFGVVALDHTAIAVRDIRAALPLYRDLLGGIPNGFERISHKGFMWLTLRYPNGAQIELLQPVGDGGFLHSFLDRYGEGAHHMTFMVRDLKHAVERARAAGLRVVDEDYRDPRWQEAFISPRSAFGTIIQLAQTSLSGDERERHWSVADFTDTD